MKARIFWSIFLTSAIILTCAALVMLFSIHHSFTEENMDAVKIEAEYVRKGYEQNGIEYTDSVAEAGPNRITVISKEGKVLCDSYNDTSTMENHTDRPEIIAAFEKGYGESVRSSETSGEQTYYYAILASDGSVVRVASTMVTLTAVLSDTVTLFIVIMVIGIAISLLISRFITKAIIEPINHIDPKNPMKDVVYDELEPLLQRMDRQNIRIRKQLSQLEAARNEFVEITSYMSEALVIFSHDGYVLSANKSAKELFRKDARNLKYNELCSDTSYINAVETAFNGNTASSRLTRNGKVYHVSMAPVKGEQGVGVILFAEDITDTERSEQLRRQFSANVSHELKTPLTTIMGSAELIKSGIAPPEDHTRFIEQIYNESKRLLSLIEDIINLSRLDEGAVPEAMQECDLYAVAEEVKNSLAEKAENAGIELTLTGIPAIVNAIPTTLYEMLYNLCDNAIKYNNRGGYARITVYREGQRPAVAITDNGIGIAREQHDRIFERFYRVDKSRSKQTGGTGLGLSIVKHAAQLHNAEIVINSELGEGTEIKIIFK